MPGPDEICQNEGKYCDWSPDGVPSTPAPHSLVSILNAIDRTTPAEYSARDRRMQFSSYHTPSDWSPPTEHMNISQQARRRKLDLTC